VLGGAGCLCVGLGFFLPNRLFFDPFLLCLAPVPSAEVVIAAVRFGPGDGGPGIDQPGQTYTVKPLECPHWVGAGSPKLTMQLQIQADGRVAAEKHIGVMVIDAHTVVVSGLR
jgi:hypothetical protein